MVSRDSRLQLGSADNLKGIVAEIGHALDWLADHGAQHGIAGPLVIAGWSAGAQLAALHLNHPSVVAGLAVSGIYDLEPLRDTTLNRALNLAAAEIAAFSPLRLPVTQKPLTIAYGSAELPTSFTIAWRLYRCGAVKVRLANSCQSRVLIISQSCKNYNAPAAF